MCDNHYIQLATINNKDRIYSHVSIYADATIKRGVNQLFFVLRAIFQDISANCNAIMYVENYINY